MEDVYENQKQLMGAITKIATNIKKDSADRKSVDYFKRRLETLEAYWADYQFNNDRLEAGESRAHPYFTRCEYDQGHELYKSTKTLINEQYHALLKKAKTESVPSGTQETSNQKTDIPSQHEDGHHPAPLQTTSTGTNSRVDEMLRRQASNFRAFMRTIAAIELNQMSQKWEFEDALRTLQSRWSTIDSIHLELDSELEGTNESYESSFIKHEKTYIEFKKTINSRLWSVSHRESFTPKMDIPVFNGSYLNWVSFKDLFAEAIHDNISLSNAQKMQFLKAKLRGEAERLIQHLQISTENYTIAWEILNHRYNNIRLIFTSHANTLLNLPAAQQASVNHIKRIHDTAKESLNAIKNLGVDTSGWGPLIVHILLQKLDTETHNHYLESLKNPRDLPSLQEFLAFLENKFATLESSRKKQENFRPTNNNQFNMASNSKSSKSNNYYSKQALPTHKGGHSPNNNAQAKIICPLCKEQHGLYFCSKFLSMTPLIKRQTVQRLNVCENCLYDHRNKACTSEKRCRECRGNHNTLIHEAFNNPSCNITIDDTNLEQQGNHLLQHGNNVSEILLATAMIEVQASDGSYHKMRALIDQGSQISLISERAAQSLALTRKRCKGVISGIGTKESSCKGVTEISISSLYNNFTLKTEAFIMTKLIKNLPSYTFNRPSWSHLEGIQLSDPDFHVSRPVDILLGADVYSHIIMNGISRSEQAQPIAQQTRLGWILCGNVQTLQCNVVLQDVDEFSKFWEIEDISESSILSQEDIQCVNYYKSTTTRRVDGSYEVRIPLKENFEKQLGSSKHTAVAQFKNLERKFRTNADVEKQYKLFIKEYESLGHMKPSISNQKPECYLPHHCVLRHESATTALRVVFNASRKTTTGQSLNDLMLRGPNMQQDLQSLLLKWRQFKYAFTADIEKMFRFIWVHEQDQCLQKIIWRDSVESTLSEYQLCTVTYGTKAAPFLAMMTLKQLADDERSNYRDNEAVQVLEQSFYMDDVLHGGQSLEAVLRLQRDLIQLLKSGGFNLRKWKSNALELLQTTTQKNSEQDNFDFKQLESTKTLGLRWNPREDLFTFKLQIDTKPKTPTKRSILSDISKLYDPLGWLSPVSTKFKLLFQKVWLTKIDWDDKLPEDLTKEWTDIKEDMSNIQQFKLERWLGTTEERSQIELHGFCDSSNKAYAGVIYCKTRVNGDVKVSLVAGKARLVPSNKTTSIPKLELSGALLLAKLMSKVQESLSNFNISIYGWADSMVVLAWLQGDPGKWKPFVANRVKQIVKIMPPQCWRYIRSAENPADSASRGMSVGQLKEHSLWWDGPSWLTNYSSEQDTQQQDIFKTDEETRKIKQVYYITSLKAKDSLIGDLLLKYSSFQTLTRVVAWILRFVKLIKQKKGCQLTYLTLQEINKAKQTIVKDVQEIEFASEIENLRHNKPLNSKSKILQFNPFLDIQGILRVGGRLNKANISPNMINPIILPHSGPLTQLVIDHAHKVTLHGGARVTLATIREKCWIIGGNRAVKKRLHTCVTCRKQNPNKMTQLMGQLPKERCNIAKPFYHTGVDYTGHVLIKANKGRGIKTTKGYIAVFICMVTKLVHIELVSDLTSSAFIAALRRMAARKGSPRHVYCDNGTNFVGASHVMAQEYEHILKTFNQEFMSEITSMEIEWHFNAPSWPSGGGLWEAAVKSVKYHLRRVIGEQRLTFEEYSTILAQIEAVLNSRPLCPLTEDINDIEFLTPSSFINLHQSLNVMETESDMRTRWYLTQKIVQDVWKRWRSEYLSQLSVRSKWRNQQTNIKINDIVTIDDANLPPGRWAVGRVVELHPGADGLVRVVTLKTKNGLIKRPVIKLSQLPVHDRHFDNESPTNISNNTDTKPKKRQAGYNFATLTTLLLFFMCIFGTCHGSYNLTQLNENQGLYFDKITDMRLIRDEWKIVYYYDLNPYWQGITACKEYIQHLKQLCNIIKIHSHCDVLYIQLQHEYTELQYYNQLLLSQHSSTRPDKRRRRGLVNGVGYLANSLFGVLDDRFAEQYKRDIQLIRDNENHLALLIENQTSIIEVEYNILKRTEDSLQQQHKVLIQLSEEFESVKEFVESESELARINNELSLVAISSSNMLRQLKTIQATLLDTITDVYHGRLNFHLISPEQLKQTLTTISNHLKSDLSLPINNVQTELRNVYSLLKVRARMTKEYAIFELHLPLLSRDLFSIMKILSIPRAVGNSIMARITPIAEYVAINLRKESYLTMSIHDITACIHDGANVLCHVPRPIYHLKNDDNLCQRDEQTGKCRISSATCANEWTELNKPNNYMFSCCGTCLIRVLCDNHAKAGHIEKAGIITIEKGCLLKTENFTIYSHNEGHSNLQNENKLQIPNVEQINQVINISIPDSIIQNYSLSSNNKELEELRKQIDTLKANEKLSQNVSYHDIHHYTAIYIFMVTILLVGAVFVVRQVRKRQTIRSTEEKFELASPQPVVPEQSALGRPSSLQPITHVYSVSAHEQCNRVCDSEVESEKVYSEIPKVQRVNQCTTPMPRKTKFT